MIKLQTPVENADCVNSNWESRRRSFVQVRISEGSAGHTELTLKRSATIKYTQQFSSSRPSTLTDEQYPKDTM
jgi:hypothetical protein